MCIEWVKEHYLLLLLMKQEARILKGNKGTSLGGSGERRGSQKRRGPPGRDYVLAINVCVCICI